MENFLSHCLNKKCLKQSFVCPGVLYSEWLIAGFLNSYLVHQISIDLDKNTDLTLLISKASEVVTPAGPANHIGPGASLNQLWNLLPSARFMINGTFNHYKKNFYSWPNDSFNIGDPVGLVKIRHHFFQEHIKPYDALGYLVQKDKKHPWSIVDYANLDVSFKYILSGSPLLIYNSLCTHLNAVIDPPVAKGEINPPGYLGHALQHHPRTAVGIDHLGCLQFFVIQDIADIEKGPTLLELQNIGGLFDLDHFLNLDGGGSSKFKLKTASDFYIENKVAELDQHRILGHTIILFDQSLLSF